MTELEEFKKCTLEVKTSHGMEITCKKKLWHVHGTNGLRVMQDAMDYFREYKAKGTYKDILE